MSASVDRIVNGALTWARAHAKLRAQVEHLQGQLVDAMAAVDGFLAQQEDHQQELDRVITAAAEGAAAAIRADRAEVVDKLMALGLAAENDSQLSEHGAEFYAARAAAYYHAAAIVLGTAGAL